MTDRGFMRGDERDIELDELDLESDELDRAVKKTDLREAVALWSDGAEEEEDSELSQEDQLASFVEAFRKPDRKNLASYGGYASNPTGRRAAPRLRLSLPARFVGLHSVHEAILLNVSCTGALIAILDAVRNGEGGFLECGAFKAFGTVTRREFNLNAVTFEEPLSKDKVLAIRRYHERIDERESRRLIETARQWVQG